jgi:hypothetical protein
MKKNYTQGFAALETLLIIVIIGLVGFVGWYVWNSNKSTEGVLSKTNTSASKDSTTAPAKYLTVSEWNVKLPLGKDMSGTTYKLTTDSTGQSVELTIPGSECDPMAGIVRGSATDNDPTTNPDGQGTYSTFQDSDNSRHVGDYYYSLIQGNGQYCFKDEADTTVKAGASSVTIGAKTNSVRTQIEDTFNSMSVAQ